MTSDSKRCGEVEALVARIDPKYRAVWEGRTALEQAALAAYFLPNSQSPVLKPARPRVIKWYCPFAPQQLFPSGHRYCLNTYCGCSHACAYCYASAYEPDAAASKRNFERLLTSDLRDLDRFDVPPAPIHLSNSTDALQGHLEEKPGHTKLDPVVTTPRTEG